MSAASAMLEIPEVRARFSPITVAEYRRLSEYNASGRRTELIRGIVVEKMSKSPLHSSIARRLYRLLQAALPPDFTLLREDPLTLEDSEPEPDLAIVRGSEEDFADRHPSTAALVIEIAVSSAAEDRSLAALYAEAGVEEYWIVLPAERRIEVHRTPQPSGYRDCVIVEGDGTLDCQSLLGIRIRLAELFA
jgi:Uma2 family endonuclease